MVQIKKNRGTTARFKNFAVNADRNFIDLETGEVVDINSVVASVIGEDEPIDINITNKVEEEVDPDLND